MTEKHYALIRDGIVENITTWDGQTDWKPDDGFTLVEYDPSDGVGVGWTYEGDGFVDPNPPLTYEERRALVELDRQLSYRETSDPVFFQWQRGTASQQDWLDAVQAVKDAHPYPDAP
jgi:hypothetical protein